jgi:N-acetylmuramoyl-L-alanine amidase
MYANRRLYRVTSASVAFLAAVIAAPASVGSAAETSDVSPILSYDIADAPLSFSPEAAKRAMLEQATAPAAIPAAPVQPIAVADNDPELECMAKVVHHEAANQSRDGQLAVAQLMMNRKQSGRFASTICGVAHQPRQFFNTNAYNPRRDARWEMALDVAREAMAGQTQSVIPGAVFYHAAYQKATSFFRTRQRIAKLGDHVFYR